MPTFRFLFLVALFSSFLHVPQLWAELIVIEGEDAPHARVVRHPWWYDKVRTNELSGGAWLSHFAEHATGEVAYSVVIPSSGTYSLWLRANPTGVLSWQWQHGPWKSVDWTQAVDRRNIAEDDKIDLRFIAWVRLASLHLSTGTFSLAFRMHSPAQHHGAIDQLVFTSEPFVPYGPFSVNSPRGRLEVFRSEDSWAFDPLDDPCDTNAVFDLRTLNETYAGQHGFIRLSEDGMSFVRGDGQPIRFWSVVDDNWRAAPDAMLHHCRFIAKRGVNMVRIHATICDAREGAAVTNVDEKALDSIFRFVAACKTNGIYLTISPYWAYVTAPRSWGISGYAQKQPWGILFFNKRLQDGYKVWVRELYTRVNPYTGLALKDDPAVAIIQIKNEDSLLFWTFANIQEPQLKLLRRRYARWLLRKYGSWQKLQAAWGALAQPLDSPARGEVDFLNLWELTAGAPPATSGRLQRQADQTEFLARVQYDFYADMVRYYRHTLGCRQLINAMNWKSADAILLDDAERWSYSATDIIAVNRYTGAIHIGKNNGYRVDPGHFYQNRPVVKYPATLPTALKQVVGHPFVITESAWVFPEEYQTEGPMLIAAHMALTGVDSLYWFALSETTWLRDPRRLFWPVRTSYALDKWSGSVPQQLGMFPANALAFRRGDIAAASAPVVYEERALENLWRRTVPIIAEEAKFDPNRDPGAFATHSPIKQDVDPLAFWVGPVYVKYGGCESNSYVAPALASCIDRTHQRVRSITGELMLDYATGVFTVNAPKYQGVAGFLLAGGGKYHLRDVTIESSNAYAAIALVALDDAPLNTSHKILVQIGTVVRPGNWTTEEKRVTVENQRLLMKEILDTGKPPWRVQNTRVRLTVKNPSLRSATLLDVNGYRTRPIPAHHDETNGTLHVQLPLATMYAVLEASP
ncbi:MAG: hypothetical protein N2595_02965 [bacterium]|nr:hypothetical protein [bacterium]